MIKQGLNIKLGQSLSMTPQLQQAIRLLQLSSVELQQEIQEVLETNPLLERVEERGEERVDEGGDKGSDKEVSATSDETLNNEAETSKSESETIPEDLTIDADWDDIYDPAWKVSNSDSDNSASDFIETMHSSPQGLHEHFNWLIQMSNLSVQDKEIARLIIDYIDETGYLTESLEQIHNSVAGHMLVELDEIEAVLTYIQHLEPIGCGARSLGECLLIQLAEEYSFQPLYKKTRALLEQHLNLLEKRDYAGIKKALRLKSSQLEDMMQLIRTLDPMPGKSLSTPDTDYITPDIYVRKVNGKWKISLNGDTQANLQINDYYASMLDSNKTKEKQSIKEKPSKQNSKQKSKQKREATHYIKENLQQARWFIKSIENRNTTIVNVAHAIIERQLAFLQYGEEAMKPMILRDLANQLGLHESTISRVTTRKYMHTPRGVYEFKYFFSSHVNTDTGGECSATAIRAMIKKLIAEEEPSKPLSDSKLTNLLKERGIKVARRTVAKYREALSIPSSHDRKVFA